jgi:hypothetical protein
MRERVQAVRRGGSLRRSPTRALRGQRPQGPSCSQGRSWGAVAVVQCRSLIHL